MKNNIIKRKNLLNEHEKFLVKAIAKGFPLIIYCNLTQDYYEIIESDNYPTLFTEKKGFFHDLISFGIATIPDDYKHDFETNFNRDSLFEARKNGKQQVILRHKQFDKDGKIFWAETQSIFIENDEGDVLELTLGRCIDDEILIQKKNKQNQQLVNVLAKEYSSVYVVNLTKNTLSIISISDRIYQYHKDNIDEAKPYSETVKIFAEKGTYKKDKELFVKALSINNILKQLQKKNSFTTIYRNEMNEYCEIKCVKFGDWEEEKQIVLGVAIKDKEIRKTLQYEKKLQREKEKVIIASNAKSEFFARMSHDIRTPLSGVIGMTELAKKNIDNPFQVKYCLDKITNASNHLINLVSDILDLSHINSNKVQIDYKPMNIRSFADGCISLINGQLVNRKINFHPEFENYQHPFVLGDERHLRQAIINILGNAIKYTDDGGYIYFRVQELSYGNTTVTYRIEVEDTGIGIDPNYIEHIWDSFSRGQPSSRTEYEGSGLGMPIAKSFVEAMGGTISVRSKLNVGSVFTIDIPFTIDNTTVANKLNLTSNAKHQLMGIKILLAEDNEMNRESEEELLNYEGAIVTVAHNGKEAVDIFANSEINSFDAILMDITMPVLDGLEATRQIRNLKRSDASGTPIIAISANAFDEDVRKSTEAGMNAHLTKPLEIAQIIKTLLHCIKLRSMDQAERLKNALSQITKDPLTKVNNRNAFNTYMENNLQKALNNNEKLNFGIIVCDVNNLKNTNDTLGHKVGDSLIINGCKKICNIFKHSPVYRVGGDEFAIILQNEDFENRFSLLNDFQKDMISNINNPDEITIASGLAVYDPLLDKNVNDVFVRADAEMYKEKKRMKDYIY